jgi:hypothetical protein
MEPSTSKDLVPPSPSTLTTSSPSAPNLDDLPPLSTYPLTDSAERLLALKLIADSIAQQRQVASKAIIVHPFSLSLWVLMLGVVYQFIYKTPADIGVFVTTVAGISMSMLVGVRMLTGGYLQEAEGLKWDFLRDPVSGEEDVLIGTKYGAEIIGALALRLEKSGGKKKKGGKGLVRAWTTKLRYRHKGIGTGLLEEAVRVTRERLGKEAELGFAADHANSKILVPGVFGNIFKYRERMALKLLEEVEEGTAQKKR